jgi:hypothetical protein
MWKRRQLFNAIFFLGTLLAVIGWMGDLRDWPPLVENFFKFGNLAITGHALQVLGAFGNMLTPDAEEVVEENREDFTNNL